MMEHIRQFDWNTTSTPEPYFVSESALDNCNVEAIVMDRFNDPLWTSSEEDEEVPLIDWDNVFKTKNFNKNHRLFVPGMHRVAPYPKLSAMTGQQHYRALRVLCAMNPSVLEEMQFHSPTMVDRHNFEQLKEIYDQEKKEYIEWAKTQWVTHHCVRALRPKPVIETTYEAEFKVRAQRLSGYPKRFEMAAQIPLECTRGNDYKAMLKETLIDVPVSDMPQVHLPKPIMRNSTIITPCSLPEPCHKHPYQFILPNENSVSILPIKEIHRELAQYAAENGSRFIASENALRCLVEFNRSWNIPVTVCSAFNNEGEPVNVVVLDSEMLAAREPAARRTFRAYRHLLEHALVPSSEIQARINKIKSKQQQRPAWRSAPVPRPPPEPDCSSDDEPLGLCILEENEMDLNTQDPTTSDTAPIKKTEKKSHRKESHDGAELTSPERKNNAIANGDISREDIDDIIGVYNCTCSDTLYEIPPPRSFKKWQFTNNNSLESIDVIVHCSHKARLDSTELVLEPIPEYQLELGGSEQPPDRIRSIALSLLLRNNASVLNARVDGYNGDMVTLDALPAERWRAAHAPARRQVGNVLHTALAELQGLVPGCYVLQHEANHGSNALLLVARGGTGDAALELDFDLSQSADVDETAMARAPPTLAPVLLPYHKFRKILPCAFTPYEHYLAKESKKAPSKQKSPPQAIQWPKRKNRKRKQKN